MRNLVKNKTFGYRVRVSRGHVVVEKMGRTRKGTKFVIASAALGVDSVANPNFKGQVSQAVSSLDALGRDSDEL